MSIVELKQHLVESIEKMNNNAQLELIQQLIDENYTADVFSLNNEQKSRINKSIQQSRNNEKITHELLDDELNTWLLNE